jgi:hypothetical protein
VLRRKRDREEHEAKFKMIKTTLIKEKTLNMVEKKINKERKKNYCVTYCIIDIVFWYSLI